MENNIIHSQPGFSTSAGNDTLQLSPIKANEDYLKEWNEHLNDFVCLTRNGKLVSNSLYRIGGLDNPKPATDRYFMLIKYVEALYDDTFVKDKTRKKHLEGRWCIIDSNGIEKVEFDSFKSPYLIKDSCIYSLNGNYYNIETGELYCHTFSSMSSKDYLFLNNQFDKDISKRGVLKISKRTGFVELFI